MKNVSPKQEILGEIEQFLERHAMSAARFGTEAMGNPSFVMRLRRGVDIKSSTIDRARDFMASYNRPPPRRRRKRQGREMSAVA